MNINWVENFNVAITIMDTEGKILYMNDKSAKTFSVDGGKQLIGSNLFDCHSKRSSEIINRLLENKETNVYTIEKKGIKKMIYQTPWYEDGECKGLVEMALEIPFDMPHFVR
jgi:transcriptional regulator with PAS, ATPase and Fis domain